MPRVLPAKVYDALRKSAIKYKGVGGGAYVTRTGCPWCGVGHVAKKSLGIAFDGYPRSADPLVTALYDAGLGEEESDLAVKTINQRRWKKNWDERVSWTRFAAELGLVRGA